MNVTSDILFYKNIVQTPSGQFNYKKPQISRNFGLRSVGVCFAYPSFDKPFLKVYADERRFATIIHRKGREERKAAHQKSLRSGMEKSRYRINNELVRTDTNSNHSEFVRVSISSLFNIEIPAAQQEAAQ